MRNYVDRIVSAFEVNLVPIVVTIASSYVLFAPGQFRESYRVFAQRVASMATVPNWVSNPEFWSAVATSIYTLLGLTALSILIWLACRSNLRETEEPVSKGVTVTRRFISLGLAALPFLSLSFGLYMSSSSKAALEQIIKLLTSTQELQLQSLGPSLAQEAAVGWATRIASYNDILIGLAIGLALLGLLLVIVLNGLEHSARANSMGRFVLSGPVVLGASVTFVVLCVVFSPESGAVAAHISAVPILCVFSALSLVVVNYLIMQAGAIGRLVVWAFAAAAIVFSIFDLSNNHRVRRIPHSVQASPTMPGLSDIFLTWYHARTDQSRFPRRYPIYVVAAQGGGIYAAVHAASFLSYMQERCPNFAHHLFAISSVSGGSVGAAVFAASMKEAELRGTVKIPAQGCNDLQAGRGDGPAFLDAATEVLEVDFWAPLQAMLLFPDMLQRFMPIRIERFDRARALEHGLEASWNRMMTRSALFGPPTKAPTGNIMAESFASLWPAGFGKSLFTPALVLNTTEVDSGRRRLIAPFGFAGLTDIRFFPINCVSGSSGQTAEIESIPLSTAAVLSARFPWITPTGWYYDTQEMGDCTPRSQRKVIKVNDGGYFESSGVASALDLTYALQKIIAQHKLPIDINLIILTSGGFASETASGLNEVLDPIRTMLNASGARGYIEVGRAEQVGDAQTEPPTSSLDASPRATVLKVWLEGLGYPLPLGWSLSTVTSYLIQFQTGEVGPCQRQQDSSSKTPDVHSSSCTINDIVRQLTYR